MPMAALESRSSSCPAAPLRGSLSFRFVGDRPPVPRFRPRRTPSTSPPERSTPVTHRGFQRLTEFGPHPARRARIYTERPGTFSTAATSYAYGAPWRIRYTSPTLHTSADMPSHGRICPESDRRKMHRASAFAASTPPNDALVSGPPQPRGELFILSRPTRRDGLTRSTKTVAENGPRPSSRSIRASSPSEWPESMALETSSGITTSMTCGNRFGSIRVEFQRLPEPPPLRIPASAAALGARTRLRIRWDEHPRISTTRACRYSPHTLGSRGGRQNPPGRVHTFHGVRGCASEEERDRTSSRSRYHDRQRVRVRLRMVTIPQNRTAWNSRPEVDHFRRVN